MNRKIRNCINAAGLGIVAGVFGIAYMVGTGLTDSQTVSLGLTLGILTGIGVGVPKLVQAQERASNRARK